MSVHCLSLNHEHVSTANTQQDALQCICSAPCERVLYEPSLSYAQLSKFNVRKLMLPSDEDYRRVNEKFITAREASQQVVAEIRDQDFSMIKKVLDVLNKYSPQLATSVNILSNETHQLFTYGITFPAPLMESIRLYMDGMTINGYLGYVYDYKAEQVNRFSRYMNERLQSVAWFYGNISSLFEPDSSVVGSNNFSVWENCISNNPSISQSAKCNESLTESKLHTKLNIVQSILKLDDKDINTALNDIMVDYQTKLYSLFADTSFNVSSNKSHSECEQLIHELNRTLPNAVNNVTQELKNYVATSSIQQKLEVVQRVFNTYGSLVNFRRLSVCAWFHLIGCYSTANCTDVSRLYKNLYQYIPSLSSSLQILSRKSGEISAKLSQFTTISETLTRYLSLNISKIELYNFMINESITQAVSDVDSAYNELFPTSLQLFPLIQTLIKSLHEVNKLMFSIKPPIAGDHLIYAMGVIPYAERSVTNRHLLELIANMSQDRGKYLDEFTVGVWSTFHDYNKDAVQPIIEFAPQFVNSMNNLKTNLQTYIDGNKMDNTFFM